MAGSRRRVARIAPTHAVFDVNARLPTGETAVRMIERFGVEFELAVMVAR